MSRFTRTVQESVGKAPGALIYVGEQADAAPTLSLIEYDADHLEERSIDDPATTGTFKDTEPVSWINITGIHDVEFVRSVGEQFGLHSLMMEDIVNTTQRAKVNFDDNFLFAVVKMLSFDSEQDALRIEQVSLICGPGYLLSFQEREGDVFDPVRERIRHSRGRIRTAGADYLAYALMDAVVDNYYIILEQIGERVQKLEQRVITDPDPEVLRTIYRYKHEMAALRRAAWPLREEVGMMVREEHPLIAQDTRPYVRDLYEHVVQSIDTIETYREMTSSMLELYLTCVSNRMNEVMKVLTIIATIFMPLSFIAGLYGMNFNPDASPWNMPELGWRFGYPAVLIVMAIIGGGMLLYFRRKRWL